MKRNSIFQRAHKITGVHWMSMSIARKMAVLALVTGAVTLTACAPKNDQPSQ